MTALGSFSRIVTGLRGGQHCPRLKENGAQVNEPARKDIHRHLGELNPAPRAGDLCRWAQRCDGVIDPSFHSERLEAAAWQEPHTGQINDEAFQ